MFEGIALNTRWMLDAVEHFTGRTGPGGLGPIRFIGGGATSTALVPDHGRHPAPADRPGRRTRSSPTSAAPRCSPASPSARSTWEQIPDLVTVERRYTPDPANREVYDRAYAALRAHHKASRGLYRELHPVTAYES